MNKLPSNEHDVRKLIFRIDSFTGVKLMLIVPRSARFINLCLRSKTKFCIDLL